MSDMKNTATAVQEALLPQKYVAGARRYRKIGASLIPTLLLLLCFVAPQVMAGGSDVAGGDGTVMNWTQGTLGRVIALTLIVVGACISVVRESLIAFGVGIAMGLALYNAPYIIKSVMSASTVATNLGVSDSVKLMIGNGLK